MTVFVTGSRTPHVDSAIDKPALNAVVDGILNRRPAVPMSVDILEASVADCTNSQACRRDRVEDACHRRHVFRIGSITKTFTAIAVPQLWERGHIDLDLPANDYLRAYRLVPATAAHRRGRTYLGPPSPNLTDWSCLGLVAPPGAQHSKQAS